MLGRTIKELLNDIQRYNNACECLNQNGDKKELSIYIDDELIYRGTSFVHFYQKLKEEYVQEFIDEVLNHIWGGQTWKRFVCRDTEHKIEIYVI